MNRSTGALLGLAGMAVGGLLIGGAATSGQPDKIPACLTEDSAREGKYPCAWDPAVDSPERGILPDVVILWREP